MRRVVVILSALAGLCLVGVPAFAQAEDLWARAVSFVSAQPKVAPQQVVSRFELLNSEGKTEHTRETHLRISYGDSGDARVELTKAIQDGQDVTEKARSQEEARHSSARSERRQGQIGFGPLEPEVQGRVKAHPLGQKRSIDGRVCLGYGFEQESGEEGKRLGEVWLDVNSGAPLAISFRPEPLPKHVSELQTTVRYGPDENGHWVAKEMEVEGKASFLLIRKRFRSVTQFGAYVQVSPTQRQ
ncbi:MAG: hypothetical protein ONB23_11130 [candidate division KSB1 bacterium]|nr:hypothetical protein [candidate division KSB1 bacterium]